MLTVPRRSRCAAEREKQKTRSEISRQTHTQHIAPSWPKQSLPNSRLQVPKFPLDVGLRNIALHPSGVFSIQCTIWSRKSTNSMVIITFCLARRRLSVRGFQHLKIFSLFLKGKRKKIKRNNCEVHGVHWCAAEPLHGPCVRVLRR